MSSRGNDGEITFREWHPVAVDEYGYAAPDPLNPDIVYGGRTPIRYDRRTHRAIGYVTLDEAAVSVMTTLVSVINGNEPEIGRSHVVGAPGRIRTCAPASGGQCSIP